jgi:hypothetical protein
MVTKKTLQLASELLVKTVIKNNWHNAPGFWMSETGHTLTALGYQSYKGSLMTTEAIDAEINGNVNAWREALQDAAKLVYRAMSKVPFTAKVSDFDGKEQLASAYLARVQNRLMEAYNVA